MGKRFAFLSAFILLFFSSAGRADDFNPWKLGVDQLMARLQLFHRPDAGPWAVAGFRIGAFAIHLLNLKPYAFNFKVTHYSPQKVQFTCMADGLQAATGASVGKLNLSLVPDSVEHLRTVVETTDGGRVTFTVVLSFLEKYLEVPYPKLNERAVEAANLSDRDIFVAEGVR